MQKKILRLKGLVHQLKQETISTAKRPLISLGFKPKVHFLIIGVQKGGTSALHSYLNYHPFLSASTVKELNFFCLDSNYSKGINKYYSYFPLNSLLYKSKVFEASPLYTSTYSNFHKITPQRIYNYNSNIKLLIVLRNPVDRAFSAWNMYHFSFPKSAYHQSLVDCRSFEDAVNHELKLLESNNNKITNYSYSYLNRGIYYQIIKEYFKKFSSENILILENEEMRNNLVSNLYKITEFLDLPDFKWEKIDFPSRNKGHYSTKMSSSLRKRLLEFYSPHNKKLFELINQTFKWQ